MSRVDIRLFQTIAMASLLGAGAVFRDFSLSWQQVALTFLVGLLVQAFFMKRLGLDRGYLSALITCFGISLLLRADSLWAHPMAITVALSSKFLLRIQGQHLLNPANFGVIFGLSALPGTWVSAGQWGSDLALVFWLFSLGSIAVLKTGLQTSTWSFLACYLGLHALHSELYLGYEWSIWLHQLSNGSLLVFAFFMISDPRTTPNSNIARLIHALVVASVAYIWQYNWVSPNALIWSLFFVSPLILILNNRFPAKQFDWTDNEKRKHLPLLTIPATSFR